MQDGHFQLTPPRALLLLDQAKPLSGADRKGFLSTTATSKSKRPGLRERPQQRHRIVLAAPGVPAGQPSEGWLEGEKEEIEHGEARPGQHLEGKALPATPRRTDRASRTATDQPAVRGPRGQLWTAPSCPARHLCAPAPKASLQPAQGRGVHRAARSSPSSADAPEKAAIFAQSSASQLALPPSERTRGAVAAGASGPLPRPECAAFQVPARTQLQKNCSDQRKDPPRTPRRGPSSAAPCFS